MRERERENSRPVTTEQVRHAADWNRNWIVTGEEFDHWLAVHDDEVRALTDRETIARVLKDTRIKWAGPSMAEFRDDPPTRKDLAQADAVLALLRTDSDEPHISADNDEI